MISGGIVEKPPIIPTEQKDQPAARRGPGAPGPLWEESQGRPSFPDPCRSEHARTRQPDTRDSHSDRGGALPTLADSGALPRNAVLQLASWGRQAPDAPE